MSYIETCIDQVLEKSDRNISEISLLNKEEQVRLIHELGVGVTNNLYKDVSFLERFHRQVALNPSAPAVAYGFETLSYKELDDRSTHVALQLQNQGAHYQSFIGLYMDRGTSVIVGVLGILKMGGVYVPIDIEYPKERVEFILSDAAISYLLVSDSTDLEGLALEDTTLVSIANTVNLEREELAGFRAPDISEEALAYMIYTSGTTGVPKGVMIAHSSLSDYVHTVKDYFGLTSNDSILQQSSISFDTSIEEIFPILGVGGKLVITNERRDFVNVLADCEKHQITVLSTNPYLLDYLNDHIEEYDLSLRILISGGDVLKWNQVDNLVPHYSVYNSYGPTEATVCATYYEIKESSERIPIGAPISNRTIYILNEDLNLQAQGVVGELCIGGVGLSKGYWNRAELTTEKFVQDPYREGEILYRTGDLARWLPDGNIEFLGRKDTQIKIRGRRIELGEIENRLTEIEKISQSKVVAFDHLDTKQLVAYVLTENHDIGRIRTELGRNLPDYMIPLYYVFLKEMPLTSNGKIDTKALPAPEIKEEQGTYIASRNEREHKLVELWKDLLERDKVSITDNFFEIGGHSLLLIKLKIAIEEALNLNELELQMLLRYPTIEEFSNAIFQKESYKKHNTRIINLSPEGVQEPIFILPGLYGIVDYYYDLAQALGENRPVYGMQAIGMQNNELPLSSVQEIAQRNIEDIRKIQPKGPYNFVGHSDGGIIALEMAIQLEQEKEQVVLAMIDSQPGMQAIQQDELVEQVFFLLERYLHQEFFTPKVNHERETIEKAFFTMKQNILQSRTIAEIFEFLENYFIADNYMETFKNLYKVFTANLKLNYDIPANNYEALIIQAEVHDQEFKDKNRELWKLKNEKLLFETSSGDHFSIVQKENAEELSKKIVAFMVTEIII
ncbi:amino acid adenylation domain-containing protein [Tenacibaculum sp. M341]|nr:amino acid adenylation domain-containing protein [Tenacibaculum sp. M341]